MSQLRIRKAAVLGAGVMGAQIAAHLVNAGVDTVLFDLPAKEGAKNGIVDKAIANLAKLSPAPLASKALASAITPANYETGLEPAPAELLAAVAFAPFWNRLPRCPATACVKRSSRGRLSPKIAPRPNRASLSAAALRPAALARVANSAASGSRTSIAAPFSSVPAT